MCVYIHFIHFNYVIKYFRMFCSVIEPRPPRDILIKAQPVSRQPSKPGQLSVTLLNWEVNNKVTTKT